MHFLVLGPLKVIAQGREVALSAAKHRALLAALLVRANQAVSAEGLINALWEGRPPASAGKTLQTFEFAAQVHGGLALSPDGKKVAGGVCMTADGEVRVWDVPSAELLKKLPVKGMEFFAVALSDDGKWVAGGGRLRSGRGKVVVWDLQTGKETLSLKQLAEVWCLLLTTDGKRLVSGHAGGSIKLWDLQARKEALRFLEVDRSGRSGEDRHSEPSGQGACLDLVAEEVERLRRWADKGHSGVVAEPGKRGVLAQESVSRMNGVAARLERKTHYLRPVEICGRSRTFEGQGLIRRPDVQ